MRSGTLIFFFGGGEGALSQNLRKATISFIMSVRPSIRMEQLSSNWKDIYEI